MKLFEQPLDKLLNVKALKQLDGRPLSSEPGAKQARSPARSHKRTGSTLSPFSFSSLLTQLKRKRNSASNYYTISSPADPCKTSTLRRAYSEQITDLNNNNTIATSPRSAANRSLSQVEAKANQQLDAELARRRNELLLSAVLPEPIKNLLLELYLRGPETVGIFRKSANAKHCRELRQKLETNGHNPIAEFHVNVIASVFKEWLRSLPDCLLMSRLYPQWIDVAKLIEPTLLEPHQQGQQPSQQHRLRHSECLRVIRQLLDTLNEPNLILLRLFMCVLWRIAENSDSNKMSANNLGVCVGQSLLNDETAKYVPLLVAFMIENAPAIFGKDLAEAFRSLAGEHQLQSRLDESSLLAAAAAASQEDSAKTELHRQQQEGEQEHEHGADCRDSHESTSSRASSSTSGIHSESPAFSSEAGSAHASPRTSSSSPSSFSASPIQTDNQSDADHDDHHHPLQCHVVDQQRSRAVPWSSLTVIEATNPVQPSKHPYHLYHQDPVDDKYITTVEIVNSKSSASANIANSPPCNIQQQPNVTHTNNLITRNSNYSGSGNQIIHQRHHTTATNSCYSHEPQQQQQQHANNQIQVNASPPQRYPVFYSKYDLQMLQQQRDQYIMYQQVRPQVRRSHVISLRDYYLSLQMANQQHQQQQQQQYHHHQLINQHHLASQQAQRNASHRHF